VRGKSGLKTAVDQCLSIPFRNTRDLELQLFELANCDIYQVGQAELSARNRARSHSGARRPNPCQRCRGLPRPFGWGG